MPKEKVEATVIIENILKPMIQDILLKSMMKHFKENDTDTYENIKNIFNEIYPKEFDGNRFTSLVNEAISDREKVTLKEKVEPKLILDKVLRELYIK